MNADQVANALEQFAERLTIKITLDITANLIKATPVDTGFARANWIPKIGKVNGADFAADVGGAQTQQSAAIAAITTYNFPGPLTVGNGVAYILPLVYGSSAQAPTGWVDRAINKALTEDIRGVA